MHCVIIPAALASVFFRFCWQLDTFDIFQCRNSEICAQWIFAKVNLCRSEWFRSACLFVFPLFFHKKQTHYTNRLPENSLMLSCLTLCRLYYTTDIIKENPPAAKKRQGEHYILWCKIYPIMKLLASQQSSPLPYYNYLLLM